MGSCCHGSADGHEVKNGVASGADSGGARQVKKQGKDAFNPMSINDGAQVNFTAVDTQAECTSPGGTYLELDREVDPSGEVEY